MAALLQYFFLAAFCWMLCEGIMLYLMLVVVFSRLSKKWWLFLLIGYCMLIRVVNTCNLLLELHFTLQWVKNCDCFASSEPGG